ncbi:dnaJ homolog subfamily C member 14-like isoform X1 [Sinocyclocheilus rhinocerous]|uniref:DnaJ homolog subfamily C member 14-like n=1 Tax=Sinocyclocheilus rhinocerous TaxID=307959 RepID=A0A673H9U4_9TELE|nr:PREDICTED: dnaJ homolog subfamily C member 14-like isoform X1 [Sinocyclocheilus rhinocerous]XP_016404318.1 PREDICTED: dnaJ homolog subfamily C member 14-like isoform X1 [Sinocyclocheilus rhinocerous]
MEEDMAVQWDTVEPPIVSLASPCYGNDSHVLSSQAPDCEHEALDVLDFDCEFPDEDFDLEVDENEEQNTKTEDLNDDQVQDGISEKDKEKFEGGGKIELESEFGGNGESRSRNAGTGRKGKSKKSGSGQGPCDQTPLWTSSMSHKSFLASSGPSRHKQLKRRNQHLQNHSRVRRTNGIQLVVVCRDFLADFVSPWCISCIHIVVELIISLTHRCGVAVESSALALYDFGAHMLSKVTDIPGMSQDLRRILDWSWCSSVAVIESIGRSARWARHALLSCWRFVCAALSAGSQMLRCIVGRLAGERGRQWWLALQSSRVWRKVSDLNTRIHECFFKKGVVNENSNPESPSRGADKWQPGEELQRLLALAKIPEEELDPFNVLGVDIHATESELKRAYRQLAVQVHPDKNKHPGAGEAFKVLRAAWDIVSNPETRREYELKRMAATELSKSMNEFLTKLQDDLKEAMNTMMCTKCEGKHKRFEMDREPGEARFCAECSKWHSAEEGDLWAESSMLGLRITYFAFMDGKVFDITEWAGCQRISISPDTHRVPYHISFGSKGSSGTSRHRSAPEHAAGGGSPADLQDFFNHFFQGGAPSDMSANGGIFPTGNPPPHSSGAAAGTSTTFSGSSPQTGFFSPGAQRGDPSEHWTDGGKPPRRRKKVRKPFQC